MSLSKKYLLEKSIPHKPGVYLFKNNSGEILYIGKAKNLHNRVRSYFTDGYADWKVQDLLLQADLIDLVETKTEMDALMLEAELISSHQPMFNRLLKVDIPFVYIVFFKKNKEFLPYLSIERIYDESKVDFVMGPFLEKGHARKFYKTILEIFKFKICNKKIENGCLDYHLGFCSGSCLKNFDSKEYEEKYDLLIYMFKYSSDLFFQELDQKIIHHSKEKEFERAKALYEIKQKSELMLSEMDRYYNVRYNQEIIHGVLNINLNHEELKKGFEILGKLINKKINILDCIDISHIQGKAITGSRVRFIQGKYIKEKFKTYEIDLDNQDDYKSLQQLVQKCYKREEDYPDVLLIDGGKGQLSAVKKILPQIELLALAKREETLFFYVYDSLDHRILSSKEPMGKLLINIRNCAHRAAIEHHRRLFRKKYKN